MSDEPQVRFNVSTDDLRRYDWQALIATSQRFEIHSYLSPLAGQANVCKDAGDDLGYRVFSLLHALASFHPNYDAISNPYGPMWTNANGTRSLNAEDLTDADLAALSGIVTDIKDPEYRARVADVLWVSDKNYNAAKIAVSAFLESAERLKTDDLWPPFAERLERAAQISAKKGFEPECTRVVQVLEGAIAEFENNPKSGLLCDRLMSILLSLDVGDCAHYSALSERLAQYFASIGNWHFSEHYWQLAERWHRRANSAKDGQRCQIEAAECNVSNGEAGLSKQGSMFAAHWISRGLEALRRAKADKSRIQAVHHRLLEIQQEVPGEMHTTTLEVEKIPGFRENEAAFQEASQKFVSGHDFRTALERFANVSKPSDFEALKKQYIETSKGAVFHQLIGSSSIDHSGKVSDRLPPLGTGTPEEQAEAQLKHLYNQARMINWPMQVSWRIEPARQAFIAEHATRRSELRFIIQNNPLIPEGHEGIFLRGIQAGFYGDWLTAMHLLIPQLETSIRHLLQLSGAITSGMRDGIQAEKDLKQLLEMPEFGQLFGPDILFDLRGIMIERFGYNLRNEFAHGLLPEAGFYQAGAVYLWWLSVHLCWRGFRLAQLQAGDHSTLAGNPAST